MVCTYNDIMGFFKCVAIQLGGAFLLLTILTIIVLFLGFIGRNK